MRPARLVTVALLLVACNGSRSAPPSSGSNAGSSAATPGDAVLAMPVDASVDALRGPALGELPKLDDVPALSFARGAASKLAKSKKLNTEGFKLHAAKDFPAAIARYKAALTDDPGNLLARYNLASATVSSGDAARGLAILATFQQPDCRACVGILGHAKTDPEWTALRDVSAFLDITRDAAPDKPDIEPLVRQLAALIALRSKKLDGLERYFHPRQPLLLTVNKREFARVASPAELLAWRKNAELEKDPFVRVPSVITCKDNCCELSHDPEECKSGCGSDMAYDLSSICFGGVGDVWFVEKADFYHFLSSMP